MSKSKYKRQGRGKFIMIEGYTLKSLAWSDLDGNARAIYIEFLRRYDGLNNGRIGFSCREAADAVNVCKDTANRAFKSLQSHGFVEITKASGFNVKGRTSTEWRLDEFKCDVTGRTPAKRYMRWMPEKKSRSDVRDRQSDMRDSHGQKTG